MEGWTGKSAVALGLLEQLSRRVGRVGVFRPVVRADVPGSTGRDYVLDLLVSHEAVTLAYEDCVGVGYDDVHADPDGALEQIVERYHRVAERCDAIVVLGSDYTDVGTPTELSYNARVAANLGAPVVLVLNGLGRSPQELRTMSAIGAGELRAQHGTLIAVVANRVDEAQVVEDTEAIAIEGVLAYAIPEEP